MDQEIINEITALLKSMSYNLDVEIKTDEDVEREEEIEDILKNNSGDEDLSELETELEKIKSKISFENVTISKYDYYDLTRYTIEHDDHPNYEYAVGEEDSVESSAIDYTKEVVDDVGISDRNVTEDMLDLDRVRNTIHDFYYYDVYDSPESYLEDKDRLYTDTQLEDMEDIKLKINEMGTLIDNIDEYIDEVDDENLITKLNYRADKINDIISSLETELEYIVDNPDGGYKDDVISKTIDNLVEDAMRRPLSFLEDYGFTIKDYIDIDEYCKNIVDSDGYGILGSYDGDYDIETVNNTDYYVFRLE